MIEKTPHWSWKSMEIQGILNLESTHDQILSFPALGTDPKLRASPPPGRVTRRRRRGWRHLRRSTGRRAARKKPNVGPHRPASRTPLLIPRHPNHHPRSK